jgi:hypothetical protein
LREDRRLKDCESNVLKIMFGPNRDEGSEENYIMSRLTLILLMWRIG